MILYKKIKNFDTPKFSKVAQKIITLRDSPSGEFEEPKDLLQFTEITDLEWEEWKEEGIVITVN